MLHGQQQEGRGMGQEGIRNMDKESQEELLLSEGPGTLSHGCSRKGSRLVYDKVQSPSVTLLVVLGNHTKCWLGVCQLMN